MSRETDIITGNLHGFYRRIAEKCKYETGETGGCEYVWNRSGSWPGYLFGIPDNEKIPEITEAIRQKKAPPFWILEDSNAEVNSLLEEKGVRLVRLWVGMIMQQDELKLYPLNPSVRIISNASDRLEEWLQIVNTELLTGAEVGREVLEAISSDDDFHWMVAYYGTQPVSTGLVFSENGVGGIYMVATRSSFRSLGLGTAIATELTNAAFMAGNHTVVLHATAMARNIYKRAGYRSVNRYSICYYLS